MQRGFG